jgi:AcrR family transcriptional regulator
VKQVIAETSLETSPRTMSKEARRQQLIEATIQVLSERGFARTTMTAVAQKAGLSHGLVNFHFETKDKLLAETLAYLAEEYRLNWTQALNAVRDDPAAQLNALIEADFKPTVCTPERLAAWCSFWGEAQSRPFYQSQNGANDRFYNETMAQICTNLVKAGGYSEVPPQVARIIRGLIEGVWLDLMTMPSPFEVQEALATVRACAALCFPRHFGPNGLLPPPLLVARNVTFEGK